MMQRETEPRPRVEAESVITKTTRLRLIRFEDRKSALPDPGYTATVNLMKLLLPALAGVLLVGLMLWPQVMFEDVRNPIIAPNITAADLEELKMTRPRYMGTDSTGRPVTITAQAMTQSNESEPVLLERPEADMELQDGGWVAIKSDTGLYDAVTERLDLFGSVQIYHDDGFELASDTAHLELDNQYAFTETRVFGQGPTGQIESEGLQIHEAGKRLYFTGKAILIFNPDGGS